jgi:hypothetical protein
MARLDAGSRAPSPAGWSSTSSSSATTGTDPIEASISHHTSRYLEQRPGTAPTDCGGACSPRCGSTDATSANHVLVADLAGQTSDPAVPLVTLWRDTWYGLERPMVPMLVLPDGYVSRGLGALARLADFAGDGAGDGAAPGVVSR